VDKWGEEVRELALQEIVRLLNEGFDKEHPRHAAAHANFIQLVQAWQQAQLPSAPKHPLEREHRKPVPTLTIMKFPHGCPTWSEIEKRCLPLLPPAGAGAYSTCVYVGEKGRPWTAWDDAVHLFIQLMTNPDRDKLAGPCDRCRKYYIKRRASQKKYCSRTCGNAATAVIRTREKWDAEHAEKLKRAHKAAHQWARSKSAESWKEYVHRKHLDITPKFLTRAVNKNELSEPKRS
jgi:hypothetical protein